MSNVKRGTILNHFLRLHWVSASYPFGKWVEAFPLQVTDILTLTSIVMDEVIYHYGVPQQLHSDQGSYLNVEVN